MKTYARREKTDKRVIEIEPSITPNSQKESATIKGILPSLTKSNPSENKDTEEGILDVPLAQWIPSKNRRKSRNTSDFDELRTPGSVVWAKKAPQMWWPAEVLIRELPAPNSGTEVAEGHVFVTYYGSEECALVDPARDLSLFDHCFKERSCNPSEEFQEALKQAIHKKEQLSLTKQVIASSEGHAYYDTGNSTSSSRTGSDYLEKGSRKRQKKKVHLDEVNVPSTSANNSRRMRMMRSLGFAPPVGSPFAQSPMQD